MRLLIVRHGEPDYSIDGLTPKGKREVELLAQKLGKMDIKQCYVSPLGRAAMTAAPTLAALGQSDTAISCEWLKEFPCKIDRPDKKDTIAWDWVPMDWTSRPHMFDMNAWKTDPIMQAGKVGEEYDRVCGLFDEVLAKHGYVRNGLLYDVKEANNDTIAFFCHFGLETVLLSHLINVSPMILWHGTCALPSSVTSVYTEERRKGIASFRISAFGDCGHLYAGDEPESFMARFCQCYDNENERRDNS